MAAADGPALAAGRGIAVGRVVAGAGLLLAPGAVDARARTLRGDMELYPPFFWK